MVFVSNTIPEILYHNCSAAKFVSIVESKKLRFTDVRLSNDEMEGRWLTHMILEYINEQNYPEGLSKFLKSYYKVLDDSLYGMMSFCMSEEPDLLSQWRGYADNARGFCIGFETSKFQNLVTDIPSTRLEKLKKVSYDHADSRKGYPVKLLDSHKDIVEITEYLDKIKNFDIDYRDPLNSMPDLTPDLDAIFEPLLSALGEPSLYSFEVKNPAFSEEKEWRAFASSTQQYSGFIAGENRIVPYIDFASKLGHLPICEVIIGPRNITPDEILKNILSDKGNINIYRSRATYR